MAIQLIMPEMGEGVIEGRVARWLKAEGEAVEQYEAVLEIETDKVTMEATAEEAGTLLEILIPAGQTVAVGTPLAVIGQSDPSPSRPPARVSPVVARIAAKHEVDLTRVTGTGKDGRVTKKDILAYLETVNSQQSTVNKEQPAPPLTGSLVPHSAMRRAIAEHMVRSKRVSPHVTTVFEFDFTAVAAHRAANKALFAKDGASLTYTAYLVAAIVHARKRHAQVNSSWRDDGVVLHPDINIGMATAVADGLIVPVIKHADSLNLLGLARIINDLADRARSKRLKPDEVRGGTFSLTNHGVSGSLLATPIINQPQCGILGAGKIEKRVKVIDDALAIRPLAYISFTFDHRILDGASADYFVATIKEIIENWG